MMEPDDDQARGPGWALPQPLHAANEGLAFLLELVMLAVKAVAFGGASVAVYSIGHHALAIAFAAVAAVNTALAAMDRNALMVTRTGLPEAPEELNRRMAWKSWLNGASPSGTGRVTGAGRARGATE
jgi:hypothetical protein